METTQATKYNITLNIEKVALSVSFDCSQKVVLERGKAKYPIDHPEPHNIKTLITNFNQQIKYPAIFLKDTSTGYFYDEPSRLIILIVGQKNKVVGMVPYNIISMLNNGQYREKIQAKLEKSPDKTAQIYYDVQIEEDKTLSSANFYKEIEYNPKLVNIDKKYFPRKETPLALDKVIAEDSGLYIDLGDKSSGDNSDSINHQDSCIDYTVFSPLKRLDTMNDGTQLSKKDTINSYMLSPKRNQNDAISFCNSWQEICTNNGVVDQINNTLASEESTPSSYLIPAKQEIKRCSDNLVLNKNSAGKSPDLDLLTDKSLIKNNTKITQKQSPKKPSLELDLNSSSDEDLSCTNTEEQDDNPCIDRNLTKEKSPLVNIENVDMNSCWSLGQSKKKFEYQKRIIPSPKDQDKRSFINSRKKQESENSIPSKILTPKTPEASYSPERNISPIRKNVVSKTKVEVKSNTRLKKFKKVRRSISKKLELNEPLVNLEENIDTKKDHLVENLQDVSDLESIIISDCEKNKKTKPLKKKQESQSHKVHTNRFALEQADDIENCKKIRSDASLSEKSHTDNAFKETSKDSSQWLSKPNKIMDIENSTGAKNIVKALLKHSIRSLTPIELRRSIKGLDELYEISPRTDKKNITDFIKGISQHNIQQEDIVNLQIINKTLRLEIETHKKENFALKSEIKGTKACDFFTLYDFERKDLQITYLKDRIRQFKINAEELSPSRRCNLDKDGLNNNQIRRNSDITEDRVQSTDTQSPWKGYLTGYQTIHETHIATRLEADNKILNLEKTQLESKITFLQKKTGLLEQALKIERISLEKKTELIQSDNKKLTLKLDELQKKCTNEINISNNIEMEQIKKDLLIKMQENNKLKFDMEELEKQADEIKETYVVKLDKMEVVIKELNDLADFHRKQLSDKEKELEKTNDKIMNLEEKIQNKINEEYYQSMRGKDTVSEDILKKKRRNQTLNSRHDYKRNTRQEILRKKSKNLSNIPKFQSTIEFIANKSKSPSNQSSKSKSPIITEAEPNTPISPTHATKSINSKTQRMKKRNSRTSNRSSASKSNKHKEKNSDTSDNAIPKNTRQYKVNKIMCDSEHENDTDKKIDPDSKINTDDHSKINTDDHSKIKTDDHSDLKLDLIDADPNLELDLNKMDDDSIKVSSVSDRKNEVSEYQKTAKINALKMRQRHSMVEVSQVDRRLSLKSSSIQIALPTIQEKRLDKRNITKIQSQNATPKNKSNHCNFQNAVDNNKKNDFELSCESSYYSDDDESSSSSDFNETNPLVQNEIVRELKKELRFYKDKDDNELIIEEMEATIFLQTTEKDNDVKEIKDLKINEKKLAKTIHSLTKKKKSLKKENGVLKTKIEELEKQILAEPKQQLDPADNALITKLKELTNEDSIENWFYMTETKLKDLKQMETEYTRVSLNISECIKMFGDKKYKLKKEYIESLTNVLLSC